jgi:DNA polymerase III delta prime subunit/uncharacterized protein YoaH (UPF0181 family)
MQSEPLRVQELSRTEVIHLDPQFSPIHAGTFTGVESLPYNDLKGPGFERLCFELLISFGYEPRFFGRTGQLQYGVDLVAERGGKTEVYQCKNLSKVPSGNDLREYLQTFESEWLIRNELPRPDRFVICCPQPLRDSETDRDWLKAKTSFEDAWGIEAGLWHLDLLNSWLKRKPDIVADLFSDRHAQVFCDLDGWNADLFKPLREDASGDLRLRRYFERRRMARLYLDQRYEQEITEALERSHIILLRGLPGTGKTLTSLAVAENFGNRSWRTYFLDVGDDDFTKTHVREGVRTRLSRPSIFVLENCHEKPLIVESVLRDLAPDLAFGHAKFICLARRVPGPDVGRSDDSELFLELEEERVIVDFENDEELFKHLIEFWRPELEGLSRQRVAKLKALCASNLLLFDEMLLLLGSATDIDTLSAASMYERVRRAYFSLRTADELRATRQLSALAQFDLRPRADVLKISEAEREVIDSLCVRAGSPPRWHFLHSSAAELILHALWAGMGVDDILAVAEEAAMDVCSYLEILMGNELRPPATLEMLQRDLFLVLSNRLLLFDTASENRLKSRVLEMEKVRDLAVNLATAPAYFRTVSLCAFVAYRTGSDTTPFYAQLLGALLDDMLTSEDTEQLTPVLPFMGLALRTLKSTASPEYSYLATEATGERFASKLIQAKGTLVELFRVLQYASPDFTRGILNALDEGHVAELMRNTVSAGCSIGTMNFALRELHRSDETTALARALESKVGLERLLDLIEANGTLFELFRFVQFSSIDFSAAMINALSEARIETLIDKTITSGRSIGTFHLALRDLERKSGISMSTRELERKIGSLRFLALIEANGSLLELLRIAQYVSVEFASELIGHLDEVRVAKLIDNMISSGRSVGTLSFVLRDLARRDSSGNIIRNLEGKIGAAHLLVLIEKNGTVLEMFKILQHTSPDFGREMIAGLDEERIAKLVAKTVSAGRSIGTLNLSIRELLRRDSTAGLGLDLIRKIGPARFLLLIETNGTIFELFKIVQQVPTDCARGMIDQLDNSRVARLIQKTISGNRSIGTLNYTLRDLHRRKDGTHLGRDLESKVGPEGFWALVVGTGSMGPLVDLLRDMSAAFRDQVLLAAIALTAEQWAQILRRGDIFQFAEFIQGYVVEFERGGSEHALIKAIESEIGHLIAESDWYTLNTAAKRLRDSPESQAWHIASRELDERLARLEINRQMFSTLREAVNGLELLYGRCPDTRPILARDLRVLLPPPETWTLDPKRDLSLPKLLLRLVEADEFSDSDAEIVAEGLARCLSPQLLSQCRTVDMLWTLWALFRLSLRRRGLDFSEFVRAMVDASNSRFATRLEQNRRDELRARFALAGLLSLLSQPIDLVALRSLTQELAKDSIVGAWWLTANQSFVTAGLVLRGLNRVAPFSPKARADFRDRLLIAADEYIEVDAAAEFLRGELVRNWANTR